MAMEVTTRWETIQTADGPMSAYVAAPADGGQYPGVLVFMEIFGVNDHIQDVTRRVAREGYVAVAPDYYHRVAPGIKLGYNKTAIDEGREYKNQTTQQHMLTDARATLDFLKKHPQVQPKDRFGSMGFCFGGYVAYVVASLPEIAATASFYGAGIATDTTKGPSRAVDLTSEIRGYMLCLFGDQDESIPQQDIQVIETALEKHNVPHKIVVYPDADHGFFCDQRASYNPEAAFAAWGEVRQLFRTHLKATAVRP